MAMRDDILTAIQAGGATRKSLLELTGTTEKGLASQFTYLRMLGNCPLKQEDGTYKIISAGEWAERRMSAGTSAVALTPEKRIDKAEKRVKRAAIAYDTAAKRLEETPDSELIKLKHTKAECELRIAEIEQARIEIEANTEIKIRDDEAKPDPETVGEYTDGNVKSEPEEDIEGLDESDPDEDIEGLDESGRGNDLE